MDNTLYGTKYMQYMQGNLYCVLFPLALYLPVFSDGSLLCTKYILFILIRVLYFATPND